MLLDRVLSVSVTAEAAKCAKLFNVKEITILSSQLVVREFLLDSSQKRMMFTRAKSPILINGF